MTTETAALAAIDAVLSDPAVGARRKKAWSRVRTEVAKIAGAQDRRGRPATVDRERIRDLRAQGLTLQQIADAVGCGVATVSRALR